MDALLLAVFLGKSLWLWFLFIVIVAMLLVFDLDVLNRKDHEIGVTENLEEAQAGAEASGSSLGCLQGGALPRRRPPRVPALHLRLRDNDTVPPAACRASASEVGRGRSIVPAAEWLLDIYHLVEAQIRDVRETCRPGTAASYRRLADWPFAGCPQVSRLAWAFVATGTNS